MRVNCSTCLELLTPSDSLVCTPCGHVFHLQCVLQWFESKKNCPQCRHAANEKNIRKIYLSEVEAGDEVDSNDLQNKLDSAQLKIRVHSLELDKLKSKLTSTEENNVKLKTEIKKAETNRRKAEDTTKEYKSQIAFWREERDSFEQYKKDADYYKRELDKYHVMEKVMKESAADVNMFLHERGCYDRESRDLAQLIVHLKKKLTEAKQAKILAEKRVTESNNSREDDRKIIKSQSVQISELKSQNEVVSSELKRLKDSVTSLQERNEELNARVLRQQHPPPQESGRPTPFQGPGPEDDDEPLENLSLSSMDSPAVAFKSSAIMIGEKRKPLSELGNDHVKKPRFATSSLLHIGTQKSLGQAYDGFGGRSKPDVFPDRFTRPQKKPAKRKNDVFTKRQIQKQTIDKFFGSFDTP